MNEKSTSLRIADLSRRFNLVDARITGWMARWGLLLLRISLGVVYLWFGLLKFFPGLSPAAGLATRTIEQLTFGLIPAETALLLLAVWETLIGLGLIFGVWMRITLLLLFVQMLGTIMPVFFFPQEVQVREDACDLYQGGNSAGMQRVTIARHGSVTAKSAPRNVPAGTTLPGSITIEFADAHVENVRLENLWTLYWHKGYVPPASRPR